MAGKTTERGEGGKTRADLEGKEGKVGGVGRLQKKRFQIFLPPPFKSTQTREGTR